MNQDAELLMPAGNIEKMRYALAFGADAVYLGAPQFSLRARENGFRQRADVAAAVNEAQSLGKMVYVTANILPHNHKVDSFEKYTRDLLDACRPDAWIMSDPGLIMFMRERFPHEVIHLSVQANTVNYAAARFWQRQGIRRIILSRELSIREIRRIHEECPNLELEAFVHGSICIAYSGRCLISNYMSYRDPNQGTCANSCRWEYTLHRKEEVQPAHWHHGEQPPGASTQQGDPYVPLAGEYCLEESERPGEYMPVDEDENGTYLMNARDLCAIEYLQELRDAGVCSFKVEGRSKSVYYTALIARAYRRAIRDMNEGKPFDPALMREVYATSNRGLIAGFLHGNPGHSAQNYAEGRSQATQYRFSGIVCGYDAAHQRLKVQPRNPIKEGMTLELVLPDETVPLTVQGLRDAKQQPVDQTHGGLDACHFTCPRDPGAYALLREALS